MRFRFSSQALPRDIWLLLLGSVCGAGLYFGVSMLHANFQRTRNLEEVWLRAKLRDIPQINAAILRRANERGKSVVSIAQLVREGYLPEWSAMWVPPTIPSSMTIEDGRLESREINGHTFDLTTERLKASIKDANYEIVSQGEVIYIRVKTFDTLLKVSE